MANFEDYLECIECQLGLRLLDFQKEFLRLLCENEHLYYIPSRHFGRTHLMRAIESLEELLKE